MPEALHAPNPREERAFPVLVLDVHGGVSTPPRLGFGVMHWHDDLQFMVVTRGSAAIDCAGQHFCCTDGQGAFFNSGVPHRVVAGDGAQYTGFVFPAKMLGFFPGSDMAAFGVGPFVGPHAQPTAHFNLSAPWHAEVIDQLRRARDILVGGEASGVERYRACTHLLGAWATYIANVEQHRPTRAQLDADERMKAFTGFIAENYGRGISLDDIARSGGVSKTECARCFKRLVQTTPCAYLMGYRIDKATELMREGELGIAAVARAVGFGSPSHFSTAFKKAMGMTPGEYLRQVRQVP